MPDTPAAGGQNPYKPTPAQVVTFLQAMAVLGETQRYLDLDRREAFYEGLQYEHQEYDWSGKPAELTETISPKAVMSPGFVPAGGADSLTVREKRPTAPKNLVKTIVNRYTGLLFSDKRTPTIHIANDPDTEAMIRAIAKESVFWSAMRSARKMGGATGAVCVTAHIDDGEFSYEVHNPKHLTVLWASRRTWKPRGILKMYRYPEVEDIVDPKTLRVVGTRPVEYLYRRIITDTVDVTFKPVKLDAGVELDWTPDPNLTVTHALGFFPGTWIQNTAESENPDGKPDCEGAYQTCDTIDRLLAQMNKGALNNLDPTPVIGVDEMEVGSVGGVRKGSDHALYVGKSGKATYLEMTGQGIEIGLKLLAELKQTVSDLTGYVFVDPEKISGAAQSAKAIEYMMAPMLERADDFRVQYGKGGAERLLVITEKMARHYLDQAPRPLPPRVDGRQQVARWKLRLPPREIEIDNGDGTHSTDLVAHKLGPGGVLTVEYGPYFAPTAQDNNAVIQNATAAKTGGLVRARTAIKSVASIFGVTDIDAELEAINQEQEQQAEMMMGGGGGVPFNGNGGGGGNQPAGDLPPGEGNDPPLALPPVGTEDPDPEAGAGGNP